ncbi:DUF2075 domain-containing protein [Companilactobacillus halodurans]|uniref:DUF2075 domain-containing protein n=1 Tax=Companilactobacillus halodurans TaxID=2584183 RepID=A0A5P0ZV81_9LACO|nr:DUF2075 domain-containing protein [Companilactobacillus halodurans]MQS96815.1 DUF2075 domain-containing protein [Companilactobacillus halodurans]
MLESVFPDKELTKEQQKVFERIETFIKDNLNGSKKAIFQLNGDAGTGKSIILTKLFLAIEKRAKENKTNNYFLVNHPELLKVYQENAGEFSELRKNRFLRPTTFINQSHKKQTKADVVVIDEAHLLLSESVNYNNFTQKNQLEEIIKLSKVVILVFDEHQVLKLKSYWSKNLVDQVIKKFQAKFEEATLMTQMRMQAPRKVVRWIDDLTDKLQLDQDLVSKKDYLTMSSNYDFRVYSNAEKMYQALKKKNSEVGESRIVATADYPSTLDGKKHYVNEGQFHLPWDQYNYSKVTWAQKPETIDEIGSIYTVQGFDLQYVAVIIGPSVSLSKDSIVVDPDKYEDQEAFKKRHEDDLSDLHTAKKSIILNSINVLLKRGVQGCFIYFHDRDIYDFLNNQR